MSTVHVLPSGGQITMLDVSDLRAKHKRAVQVLIESSDPNHPFKNAVDTTDLVIGVVTTDVSLPYSAEVKKSDGSLADQWIGELTIEDLVTVDHLAVPLAQALFPAPVSADDADKPDSPSVPESE
jgi:hypothetical protein